jgi:hypothetical protein
MGLVHVLHFFGREEHSGQIDVSELDNGRNAAKIGGDNEER